MKKELYQTIIFLLTDNIKNDELQQLYVKMKDTGSIFFLCNNSYDLNNFINNSSLDFLEKINSIGFNYINTIILPRKVKDSDGFDNVQYLLWFVKDHKKMFFLKDKIREKHIWKDVEWGKRKKNYNPNGKDPGNVWLPTNDDGRGKITEHLILEDIEILERCVISTSKVGDNILIYFNSELPKSKVLNNRKTVLFLFKNNIKKNNSKVQVKKSLKFKKIKPVIFFDTAEIMPQLENNSVDLMVTSPPYWDLKNYLKDGQIGQEGYNEYLDRLKAVWKETLRVLKKSGSMWININTRTKNKKPILIPQDIINQCRSLGFKLNKIIIWHKSSAIPTHKNNIVDRFEYFLWFAKSDKFYYDSNYMSIINDYKNENMKGGLIWNINRKAGSVGKDFIHPAIFPVKLIERVINLCTVEGQLILDPFLGSGTSLIAAENTKRSFVGYEYNEDFELLIKHRLKNANIDQKNVEFINTKTNKSNFKIFR
tara:strand:- start:115 stop:1557 length:1443 start_codon:yes stop_codon:yes gene_type:complete